MSNHTCPSSHITLMKLLGISLFRSQESGDPKLLTSAYEVSSFGFFQRGGVKEFLGFYSTTIASKTPLGLRQSVQEQEYMVHAHHRPDGLICVACCDAEYPGRVAFSLLNKVADEFQTQFPTPTAKSVVSWPQLDAWMLEWQDPAAGDKLTAIQRQLDETKVVLHNTIEALMERGEKIDDLVASSSQLSATSKTFYKQAKATNRCCVIQ